MMNTKLIYEHISIDGLAEYQIKVKGDANRLQTILKIYQTIRITSESSDPESPVSMIALRRVNQKALFVFINTLLSHGFPIISVICCNIEKKAEAEAEHMDDNPPTAMTA